jgi:hypothetical protein
VADRVGIILSRIAMGNLARYGLKPAQWQPFSAHRVPILDVGFVAELKRRRIHVRPNVVHFTRSGVMYEDGSEEAFDVVIAATGFKAGLDQVLDVPDVLDERGYPRFPSGQPTTHPGLFFMGYTESIRGHLYEANLDSRRLAELIAGYLERGTA